MYRLTWRLPLAGLVAFSHLRFSQIRGRQPYLIVRNILYVIPLYPVKPMMEAIFTIRPAPSAIILRTTYLVRTIGESVFTRIIRSISELCIVARTPAELVAALLTSP